MDWKSFGKKISAAGTLLASGSVTTAFLTLPTDTPGPWVNTVHKSAIALILLGGALSGIGKLIAVFANSDEQGVGGRSGTFPAAFILIALSLPMLSGCISATANRKSGEQLEAAASDQAYANLSDLYDAQEKANIINHTRRLDLELKADFYTLDIQSRLDAPKWTPGAIAQETTRLQALHDSRIAAYKDSILAMRALKAKNESVNLGVAHKLRDALNPPATTPLINQSAQIQSATGAPVPGTLVQP